MASTEYLLPGFVATLQSFLQEQPNSRLPGRNQAELSLQPVFKLTHVGGGRIVGLFCPVQQRRLHLGQSFGEHRSIGSLTVQAGCGLRFDKAAQFRKPRGLCFICQFALDIELTCVLAGFDEIHALWKPLYAVQNTSDVILDHLLKTYR